jgi:hypothetical protein
MWHGMLVAFGLTRKFGSDCWWHLELTRNLELTQEKSGIRFWYSLLEFASGGSGRS